MTEILLLPPASKEWEGSYHQKLACGPPEAIMAQFSEAFDSELALRQAAHDAIEITELKCRIVEMDPEAEIERLLYLAEAKTAEMHAQDPPEDIPDDFYEVEDDGRYDGPEY